MKNEIILKPTFIYAVLISVKQILLGIVLFVLVHFLSYQFSEYYELIKWFQFVALVPILYALYNIIYWRLVKYVITINQIKYIRGVFALREDYLELYRVKDFEKYQPLLLRIFGIMNFNLQTSDKTHPILELKGIPVSNIPEIMRELVQKNRIENRVLEVD